jgi:4-hydroxybenzoate polyprenyltransferase
MSGGPGTPRALLELARASNLPTCLTNVLVGVTIGSGAAAPDAVTLLIVGAAVALLYVGGMALNDVVDVAFDREHNAGRPIPSGRVSRGSALAVAVAALAGGVAVAGAAGAAPLAWAGVLAVVIVTYDLLHKRLAASIVLMGACRGLVYVVGAAAAGGATLDWPTLGPIAGAMTLYVILLTANARGEHAADAGASPLRLAALPAVLLLPVVALRPATAAWTAIAIALLVLWLLRCGAHAVRRPPRMRAAVMGWLAAICLADAYFLTLLDRPVPAAGAGVLFVLTILGHRRILGS